MENCHYFRFSGAENGHGWFRSERSLAYWFGRNGTKDNAGKQICPFFHALTSIFQVLNFCQKRDTNASNYEN